MWEILFLFAAVILAIVLTLPEVNPLRKAVITFPFFIQTALKQKSLKKAMAVHLPAMGKMGGGCKSGACAEKCGKKPSAEQIRLFQEQMAQMKDKQRQSQAKKQNDAENSPRAIAVDIPDEDELD